MTLVITTCTNRKRQSVVDGLRFNSLPPGNTGDLAAKWAKRLRGAKSRHPAVDVYAGRNFQECRKVAEGLTAELLVISAGLGLVAWNSEIPAYSCTIVAGSDDSVSAKVGDTFSAMHWWSELCGASPFSLRLSDQFEKSQGLVLAALSDAYLAMVANDLLALSLKARSRLRLFTRAPLERVAAKLRPYVMPYDERLDGPDSAISGTLSDFPSRALSHFGANILGHEDDRSALEHAAAVGEALAGWRRPEKATRRRLDDSAILAVMRENWNDAIGMSLGRLRGEFQIACEQGRYAALARSLRSELA